MTVIERLGKDDKLYILGDVIDREMTELKFYRT